MTYLTLPFDSQNTRAIEYNTMTIESLPQDTTNEGMRRSYLFAHERALGARSELTRHANALQFRARRWGRAAVGTTVAAVAAILAVPDQLLDATGLVGVGLSVTVGAVTQRRRGVADEAQRQADEASRAVNAFVAAEVITAAEAGQRPAQWARWEIMRRGLPELTDMQGGEFPAADDVYKAMRPQLAQYTPPEAEVF